MKKTNNNVATASKEVKKSNRINNSTIMDMLNNIASSINTLNNRVNTLESAYRVSKDNSTSPFYASKEEAEVKKGGLGLDVSSTSEEKKLVSSEVSAERATSEANASMNSEEAEKAVIKHNAGLGILAGFDKQSVCIYDDRNDNHAVIFKFANFKRGSAFNRASYNNGLSVCSTMKKDGDSFVIKEEYANKGIENCYVMSRPSYKKWLASNDCITYAYSYGITSDLEVLKSAFIAKKEKKEAVTVSLGF